MFACRHPGLFFGEHPADRKKTFSNYFEIEKVALIFIYLA